MSIEAAIANHNLLGFDYKGHSRVVEPHAYGIDSKGHRALRAYQVRGTSSSRPTDGWRVFHERDMRNVTVLPETFSNRPDYTRNDSLFHRIIAQV